MITVANTLDFGAGWGPDLEDDARLTTQLSLSPQYSWWCLEEREVVPLRRYCSPLVDTISQAPAVPGSPTACACLLRALRRGENNWYSTSGSSTPSNSC
ncbi:hypothetical protein O3P69_006675 [Scylla paramamosain]|uniref:Uncharacterized protein n=1 Tax=Scylla paramamosain TaxID=85552 RepID=A0AAW0U1S6_SCYPA